MFLMMLEDKIWKYASLEHENEEKSFKTEEIFIKLVKQSQELMKLQSELEGNLRPIQVMVERVQQIFVSVLDKVEDPKLKMEMYKELDNLRDLPLPELISEGG